MKAFFKLLPLMLLTLVLLNSCKEEEEEEFKPDLTQWIADAPDDSGNVLIMNNSGKRLVLYRGETKLKNIPASSEDYLVYIENPNEIAVELTLYKWDSYVENIDDPMAAEIFKKWKITVSKETTLEKRVTWLIGQVSEYLNSATVSFNYYGSTENQVEVYLDGKNGAKIMSLKPGDQYKSVGLDYGTHSLHYRYWYSNPNSPDSEEEIGWRETQTIMSEEKSIWLVLNDNRNDETIIIPHFGAVQALLFGNIRITNVSGDIVSLFSGSQLIEEVCYLESGDVTNLSSINHNDTYTFTMPINIEGADRQEYIYSAKNSTSGNVIEEFTTYIFADSTINWIIDGVADKK